MSLCLLLIQFDQLLLLLFHPLLHLQPSTSLQNGEKP